jgi:hypothetical protein
VTGRELQYYEGQATLGAGRVVQAVVCYEENQEGKRIVLTNLKKVWINFEKCFLRTEAGPEWSKCFSEKSTYCKIAKQFDLYIKIKNKNINYNENSQLAARVINRKNIVNRNGQRLWVMFENEFS